MSIPRKKIDKFFKDDRLEIVRILIQELEPWEDVKAPTTEEFLKLVERIYQFKLKSAGNKSRKKNK